MRMACRSGIMHAMEWGGWGIRVSVGEQVEQNAKE